MHKWYRSPWWAGQWFVEQCKSALMRLPQNLDDIVYFNALTISFLCFWITTSYRLCRVRILVERMPFPLLYLFKRSAVIKQAIIFEEYLYKTSLSMADYVDINTLERRVVRLGKRMYAREDRRLFVFFDMRSWDFEMTSVGNGIEDEESVDRGSCILHMT